MRASCAALVVLLGLLIWAPLRQCRAQTEEYQPPPYRVCTINVPPMAICEVNNTDPSSFSGLSIDYFRDAASLIGWTETDGASPAAAGANETTYYFRCLGVETGTVLREELVPEDGSCDIFVAWTTISAERTELGVQWAVSYYPGSVSILVASTPALEKGWGFFDPFTWDLWVAMGVTAVVLPIIVYSLEIFVIRRRIEAGQLADGYHESLWRTLWVLIQGETFGVSKFPARLVVITFAFFALILSSSYTANLAAFLTTQSYGDISNIYDLRGRAVSSVEVYGSVLEDRYRLQPRYADVSSLEKLTMEAEKILQGELSAVVIDTVVAQYLVADSSGQGCPWALLSETILPFPYGIGFSPTRVSQQVIQEFNAAILYIQEQGMVEGYEENYLLTESPCLNDATSSDTTSIGFMQVYGLWVMLAAAIGLAVIYVIVYRIWRQRLPDGWVDGLVVEMDVGKSRTFARGDSREVMESDLHRIESHI
jgi:ABC-type amino acid transport substrate-binding protein